MENYDSKKFRFVSYKKIEFLKNISDDSAQGYILKVKQPGQVAVWCDHSDTKKYGKMWGLTTPDRL